MYRGLLRAGVAEDLARLRCCVSAGEPLPATVAEQWFEATGVRIVDGIGSTEMLHIFIAARAQHGKFGSVGTPVPGYEAMVVDAEMRPLPPGTVGRLAVRGPTGCRYLDDERQTEYVVGGWNVTGDAFRVDDDGYFFFEARNDDLIVSSGYNISPFEVETALLEHAAVAECAVVADPDEERGHVVKAYVVLAEGAAGDGALVRALQDHVKERIAPYKYPRRIEFLDALPRTPTGKVQRSVLREREGLMEVLQPPGWPRPRGYANGIAAEGRIVFVAGQIGWDEEQRFEAGLAGQFRRTLANVLAVLAEAGGGPEHVARMTWYVTDREAYLRELEPIGAAYRELMGRHYPAMAVVVVAGLIEPEALVEIEATAVLPR